MRFIDGFVRCWDTHIYFFRLDNLKGLRKNLREYCTQKISTCIQMLEKASRNLGGCSHRDPAMVKCRGQKQTWQERKGLVSGIVQKSRQHKESANQFGWVVSPLSAI